MREKKNGDKKIHVILHNTIVMGLFSYHSNWLRLLRQLKPLLRYLGQRDPTTIKEIKRNAI